MAISKDYMDFLLDTMNYYEGQYSKIADNCFDEVNRALNEICKKYFANRDVKILPFGSYAIKSNYQIIEPMEFYAVFSADKKEALERERVQRKMMRKRRQKQSNSIKNVYDRIMNSSDITSNVISAFDVANVICQEMKKYISEEDKVYYINNTVFLKFHIAEDKEILINIIVAYDFDKSGLVEFSKLGYLTKENLKKTLLNIEQKNLDTDCNYLLICKLLKMLELELILGELSNVFLCNKSLFVEKVLYNVPNKFFAGNDYSEMLVKIINYLSQCETKDFILPDGTNMPIFSAHGYYANSMLSSFMRKVKYLNQNCEQLIDNAITKENEKNKSENFLKTPNQSSDEQNENDENIKKLKK